MLRASNFFSNPTSKVKSFLLIAAHQASQLGLNIARLDMTVQDLQSIHLLKLE